jgi:hypothetical protein
MAKCYRVVHQTEIQIKCSILCLGRNVTNTLSLRYSVLSGTNWRGLNNNSFVLSGELG